MIMASGELTSIPRLKISSTGENFTHMDESAQSLKKSSTSIKNHLFKDQTDLPMEVDICRGVAVRKKYVRVKIENF